MNTSFKCKKCGAIIEITEAIIDEARKEIIPKLQEQANKTADEKLKIQKKDFEVQIKQRDDKLDELRNREVKLIGEKAKLEQDKREMELRIAREVEVKSKGIFELAFKRAEEEHAKREHDLKLKLMEQDKTNESLKKDLAEANRKAQVGSQQLQGEVFEIEIKEILKKLFPHDLIQEIAKGVNGSDIRHIIKSPLGMNCGVILWECKRTKNWQSNWIAKLKADLMSEKADIPVIVSTVLPKEFKTYVDLYDGVYICDFAYVSFLASTLREKIIAVAKQKAISANRETKAERLYTYITNNEFRQQLKFMFETYKNMKDQTDKERKVFEKLWKERDFQIEQLVKSTVRIYSSIAAQLGNSAPQIDDFDIALLGSGNK